MPLPILKTLFTLVLTVFLPVLHASTDSIVLPADEDYTSLASSYIYGGNITSDPTSQGTVLAAQDEGKFEAFIINQTPCITKGTDMTYKILIRNSKKEPAEKLTVEFTFPQETEYINASPKEDVKEDHKLTWFPAVVPPNGGFIEFAVSVSVPESVPVLTSNLQVKSSIGDVVTDHKIVNQCGGHAAGTGFFRSKIPSIICDPAEVGCTTILPSLGLRFQQVQQNGTNPTICSPSDPRGCIVKIPILGKRFQEAIADIIPGECRVLEDDLVALPAMQDALNRRGEPAAYFMRPLYESGQDFIQLVNENDILDISHIKQARLQLYAIHSTMWRQHQRIVDQVLQGTLSSDEAKDRLNKLLEEWQDQIEQVQQDLAKNYSDIQDKKRDKFDPVANKAIDNAVESITRACGAPPDEDEDIIPGLEAAREAYFQNLRNRSQVYPDSQNFFAQLSTVKTFWDENLYPVLDDEFELRKYQQAYAGQGLDKTFDPLFEAYYQHVNLDDATDNQVRLQFWEVALDAPKTVATLCEKEKVFHARVETSWCESNDYVPNLWTTGAPSVREQQGTLQFSTQTNGNGSGINPGLVEGVECGGREGDPYWSASCECHCNELVRCPSQGNNIVACQQCYPITRHDIYVTSQDECFADGQKHADPFF